MPRDGSGVYQIPFPDVISDTTIESTVYNGFTNDVKQDLNAPRPIIAGGTGATSAADALVALSGEKAGQLVTNYDSFVFEAGSFYSASGATGAPTSNPFSGICYKADASNIVIEGRDSTTGIKYFRKKSGGAWGAFTVDGLGQYVRLTGDTMTGALQLGTSVDLTIQLHLVAANGQKKYLRAVNDGSLQWVNNANTAVIMTLNDLGQLDAIGGYRINGIQTLARAGGYTYLYDGAGVPKLLLGGAGDPTNYSRNGTHYFQNIDASVTFLAINASGMFSGVPITTPSPAGGSNDSTVPNTNWVRNYAQARDPQLFAGIPTVQQGSGYVTQSTDAQKCLLMTGAAHISGAGHSQGTCLTFFANGGPLTIDNTETMYYNLGGNTLTGVRTLSSAGLATALKITPNVWVISGNGLT